jgi:hypothetical protein
MFRNITLIPRVEALISSSVIKRFQEDGTFRIADESQADATLKGEVIGVTRSPARSLRENVLATTEFNLFVRVRYTLTGKNGQVLLGPAESIGTTSFFVGSDVVADQRLALPLAAEEVAGRVVSQLSEGW